LGGSPTFGYDIVCLYWLGFTHVLRLLVFSQSGPPLARMLGPFGDAQFYGSAVGQSPNAAIVGMATDNATGGYWLVASNGTVFHGNAPNYGVN